MSVYVVTYDLNSPGQKHAKILEKIKNHPWARLSESCYSISTELTAQQVYNDLSSVVDDNDTVYIFTISYPYAGFGDPKVNDWIETFLPAP